MSLLMLFSLAWVLLDLMAGHDALVEERIPGLSSEF